MARIFLRLIPLLLLTLLAFCNNDKIAASDNVPEIKNYLHIAHTRTNANPKMDSVVERLDLNEFDMVWLGGDVAQLTSADDKTITHVDSIFDIGNKNTLWSLGNHDYTDLNRIQKFTKRPPFYAYHKNGLTFIVLDTQDSLSSIVGAQKKFFEGIVDTIQDSSHLIILLHKLIWMYGNPDLEPQIPTISNGRFGDCFHCINPNNFYKDLYPKLLKVKQKGIEVFCIGGDIGFLAKEFEYNTSEGIHFLASGIYSGKIGNKALVFHHDIVNKQLTYEFRLISDLKSK